MTPEARIDDREEEQLDCAQKRGAHSEDSGRSKRFVCQDLAVRRGRAIESGAEMPIVLGRKGESREKRSWGGL